MTVGTHNTSRSFSGVNPNHGKKGKKGKKGKLKPRIVLSKCTLQSARVSPSRYPYPYVLFRRGLSGRSYDLLFDNNVPYYSLEKMISERFVATFIRNQLLLH